MSLSQRDSGIIPDAIFGPDDMPDDDETPVWAALDPCPSCGSRPHDAPEGTNLQGEPHWDNDHCWKCGFRAQASPTEDMRRREMFAAFQQFMAEQTANDMAHPSLGGQGSPSSSLTEQSLRQQVQDLQQQLAAQDRPNVAGVPVGTGTLAGSVAPSAVQGGPNDPAPSQQAGPSDQQQVSGTAFDNDSVPQPFAKSDDITPSQPVPSNPITPSLGTETSPSGGQDSPSAEQGS